MMQRKTGGRIRRALGLVQARAVDIIMFVVAVLWLIPTVGLFVQSLRTGADIGQSGWWTALANPRTLTLNSYIRLLNEPTMLRALKNTFIITIPSTILVVGVAALAAYALAWIPLRERSSLPGDCGASGGTHADGVHPCSTDLPVYGDLRNGTGGYLLPLGLRIALCHLPLTELLREHAQGTAGSRAD